LLKLEISTATKCCVCGEEIGNDFGACEDCQSKTIEELTEELGLC
jgi:hypothetical protein